MLAAFKARTLPAGRVQVRILHPLLKSGSPSRCRIRTFFTFPVIIGINQARNNRAGIVLPLAKEWLPMEELPKPKVKPALGAILAGLGPIKTLGDKIRYYRIKNLFKQEDLAKRLGVGTSAVCQWEGDQTSPRSLSDISQKPRLDRSFNLKPPASAFLGGAPGTSNHTRTTGLTAIEPDFFSTSCKYRRKPPAFPQL